MNDTLIVTIFVTLDDLLRALGHRTDCRARASDSEVLTVAVIAACQLQNHHERALCTLRALGYLSGPLSLSRFNRRLHRLAHWLAILLDLVSESFAGGTVFIIDSLPLPVCRRARAWRCRKVRGALYCGYCAAKEEKFFGWRLHLVVTPAGIPVAFDLLPASLHDLTPVHDLTQRLPSGVTLYGDKAYNSAEDEAWIAGETGIRLIPRRRGNMNANTQEEQAGLRRYRGRVETVNSQLAAWGVQRLHARTHEGWVVKVLASLFALLCVNAD
jgi:hypothetical protein